LVPVGTNKNPVTATPQRKRRTTCWITQHSNSFGGYSSAYCWLVLL